MNAVVFEKYGQPEVLQLKEVARPVPRDNEVLVKVYAASINDWDWELLRGTPFANRVLFGLLKPRKQILGSDIAGQVEAVGSNVTKFQSGDAVFGDIAGRWGGFAEYVCAKDDKLMMKPADMTFEEAASIPQAALLALQGLSNKGQVQPGQKVLLNGAGGGAGTFAVQIAKFLGADVTGVDNTGKLDIMRSIGADRVIDYTREDFTKNGQHYDFILDFAAYHSIIDYKRSLSPKGTYIMVGGSSAISSMLMFLGPWISMIGSLTGRYSGKKMSLLMHKPNKGLNSLMELIKSGKVVPVIDKCYPLNEINEAFRYFGKGQARGKVVITIDHKDKS